MRPLRLRIEGFTSFREPQEVVFEGLDLFAIAGPTGSGKTSLLDAIVFALYGTVPRLSSNHRELISLGKDRLSVLLDFARGAERFRVTRTLKRGAKVAQGQALLERLDAGGEFPVADGVRLVDSELLRLVGLSYDAFTQAVILPQGEFARFLKSAPKDRREILRDLLRLQVYERMRQKAEAEAKAVGSTVKALDELLASAYAGATPEAVAGLETALAARRDANAALAPKLAKQEQAAELLRRQLQALRDLDAARKQLAGLEARTLETKADETRLAEARRAEAVVPRIEASEAATTAAAAATREAEAAQARVAEAVREHEVRQANLARAASAARSVPELDRRIEALAQAVALQAPLAGARQALAEAQAECARARREAEAAAKAQATAEQGARARREAADASAAASERARARVTAVEQAVAAAEAGLREAERSDAVAHLRHGLRKGDACPVCERPLAAKPPASAQAGAVLADCLAARQQAEDGRRAAQQALEAAREKADAARAAAEAAQSAVAAAGAKNEAAAKALAGAEAGEASARGRLAELERQRAGLGAEGDPAAAQGRLKAERERLLRDQDAARAQEQAAATARATAEAQAVAQQQAAARAEDAAREAAERARAAAVEAGFASPAAARAAWLPAKEQQGLAEAVASWGQELHAARERVAQLESATKGAKPDAGALARAEAELLRLRQERETGVREESALEQKLQELTARAKEAASRRRELTASRERLALVRQLANDLKTDAFQDYLLAETFSELIAGASERLRALSGRYTLEYRDDGFHVLDHDNAGERRRAETLSGGETFVASLALALELSQHVQRAAGAVHLDSLFIDEGFGALDAETLDTVAAAIESLQVGGRMVGIVTHIEELNRRLPARISVRREGSSSRAEIQLN